MIEASDYESVLLAFALLGPGFIILFARSQFLTGRVRGVAQAAFEYLMVSSVYYAAFYPAISFFEEINHLVQFAFFFLIPGIIGVSLGVGSHFGVFRKILAFLRLNPVHGKPTAWDYAFAGRRGLSWVVVNLHSGGTYYGVFGRDSLASSMLQHRDVYLEDVRTRDFATIESDGRKRSVWISESDIRSIEIIKDQKNV